MQQWIGPVVVGVPALLTVVLLVLLVRGRARTARELRAAHAESASLRAQVEEIERRLAAPAAAPIAAPAAASRQDRDYVITHLGDGEQPADVEQARIDGALFADLVLREAVVKAASMAYGLRRALAAETRHRIRFEVRSQTRAARKERRRELRELSRRRRTADATRDAA